MFFAPWIARDRAAVPDDAGLAARVAAGDGAALDLVYRRESGPVYRYALAMCADPAAAADATQEAFVAFAIRPGGYDASRGSLGAYLAGAARHVLLAQWRRPDAAGRASSSDPADGRRDGGPPDAGSPTPPGPDGESDDTDDPSQPLAAWSPEAVLVRHQAVDAVRAALRRLPWAQREAVVLVDLQERSYQQAAAIAGVELNTLRTRLHRARARLAELLAAEHGPTQGDPT